MGWANGLARTNRLTLPFTRGAGGHLNPPQNFLVNPGHITVDGGRNTVPSITCHDGATDYRAVRIFPRV